MSEAKIWRQSIRGWSLLLGCMKQPAEVFCKKRCSQKFRKIHSKTPVPESLFDKVTGLRPATLFKKKSLTQIFSFEFCEISKNTFFTEQLRATASKPGIHWMDKVISRSYYEKSHEKLRLSWSCFDNLFIPSLFQKIRSVRDNSKKKVWGI